MVLPKITLGIILALFFSLLFFSFSPYTQAAKNNFYVLASKKEPSDSGLTYSTKKLEQVTITFLTPTPQQEQQTIKGQDVTLTPTPKISEPTKPSLTPKAKRLVKQSITPTPTPQPTVAGSNDDIQKHIMQAINEYRRANGLSEVKTDPHTCAFAKTRAQEITSGFNHDGFRSRIDGKSLPYPSYSTVTENIAQTTDHTRVVPMWVDSPGHAENMRKDTPFVCVEREGDFYAYLGWKP